MKERAQRSLKAQNMKWLVSLACLDIVMLVVFAYPTVLQNTPLSALMAVRASVMLILPVAVLLLSNLVSPATKTMAVYWRFRNVLPGHRAFSKYGPDDTRVDMATLRKNVGALPTEPAEQNAVWYKLYKRVESEVSVSEAQKMYLLWRDAAALSLPLVLLAPLLLWLYSRNANAACISVVIFACQYLLTAIAARHNGIRFVCNVLAIHSAKRITASARSKAPVEK